MIPISILDLITPLIFLNDYCFFIIVYKLVNAFCKWINGKYIFNYTFAIRHKIKTYIYF